MAAPVTRDAVARKPYIVEPAASEPVTTDPVTGESVPADEDRAFLSPDAEGSDGEPVVNPVKARQSENHGHMLTVLWIGLALMVVAFIVTVFGTSV